MESLFGVPWPFLAAVLLSELTPGPNMAYLAMVALQRGRRAGLAVVAGVTLGLSAYLVASVAGLAEIVMAWPWVYEGLRWAGVFFLVYLALEAARPSSDPPVAPDAAHGPLFRRGLVVNLLNPKAAIFYLALLPGFIDPGRGHVWLQALKLGAVHIVVSIVVHSAIVLGAGAASAPLARLSGHRLNQAGRAIFVVLLLVVAAWIAWDTRPT